MEPFVIRVEDTDTRSSVDYAFIRSPVRLGRSQRNDITLPQRSISAWHAVIEFDARGASFTDLGSTNGSLVDGEPAEPRAPVTLGPGAEVMLGSIRLTFPVPAARETSVRTAVTEARRRAVPPPVAAPAVKPGGITAIMQRLAEGPPADFDQAWRRVLFPGTVIGRFELVREVGRGSFGIVFEAKDRQLGRLVAFKAVLPGRESQVRARQQVLQKEAEAVAQLSHPNIVSLHDVGTCESGPYLIFELLKGETLQARMRRGRIPLPQALEIAIEIAWALDHAHAAGVVHRDLKPANVFLCGSGPVKVLDFGIAHVFGGGGALRTVGTPAYMAPEQWREGPQDARADVFGAAAMLAEMITGRLPYRVTRDWSSVLDDGARPDLEAPAAPSELKALLRRALSADPGRRPQDGHAWLTALLAIQEQLDTHELQRLPPGESGAGPRQPGKTAAPRAGNASPTTARQVLRRSRVDAAVLLAVSAAVLLVAVLVLWLSTR